MVTKHEYVSNKNNSNLEQNRVSIYINGTSATIEEYENVLTEWTSKDETADGE